MVNKTYYIESEDFNPYKNLALEEYLLDRIEIGEAILYLWQNEKTVVIGKNQNPWKECKSEELEKDGGRLARRLSGGGAVFHDLGNLNFTFIVNKEDYDVKKQLEVIVKAMEFLGIKATPSGRNDITIDGRKFSGNAFFHRKGKSYHHGTILIDVNMAMLSKYLNVSKEKLSSKGVESVKSRVINVKEYKKDLTIDMMKTALKEAFNQVYGIESTPLEISDLDLNKFGKLHEKYESWEWKFGRKIPFTYSFGKRFSWGDMEFQLEIDEGRIKEVVIYSDAMEIDIMEGIAAELKGCIYSKEAASKALNNLNSSDELTALIIQDAKELIAQQEL